MAVDTMQAGDRRQVHYADYEALLDEVEQLLSGEVRTAGNWSLGQVLRHLAEWMHASIDGMPYRVGPLRRTLGRLFLRRRFLDGPIPAGMRLPHRAAETLVPGRTSGEEGLAALRRAIHRLRAETERVPHPLIGKLSADDWDRFHLRHAELHMSFMLPVYDRIGALARPGANPR